jgi:hypothetical protein
MADLSAGAGDEDDGLTHAMNTAVIALFREGPIE